MSLFWPKDVRQFQLRLPHHHSLRLFRLEVPHRLVIQTNRSLSTSYRIPLGCTKCIRNQPSRISLYLGIRKYSSAPPKRPTRPTSQSTISSFPQHEPRPLKPLYKNKVFWGGVGFIGLLLWSPIPGWIILGGIGYGFYRLFRFLNRAREEIFQNGPFGPILSSQRDGASFLDSLFARDPYTREMAASIQEAAMRRMESAIEVNEGGIRQIFPVRTGETTAEFHFSLPTEVSMVQQEGKSILDMNMVNMKFEIQIKFMVDLGEEHGRKGAQVVARANVLEEGIELKVVDIREMRGGRRIRLEGESGYGMVEGERPEDESGVGKGEGEGKTIDATKWTSR